MRSSIRVHVHPSIPFHANCSIMVSIIHMVRLASVRAFWTLSKRLYSLFLRLLDLDDLEVQRRFAEDRQLPNVNYSREQQHFTTRRTRAGVRCFHLVQAHGQNSGSSKGIQNATHRGTEVSRGAESRSK